MHRIDPSPLTIRFDLIYRRPALCCPPAVVANAPMTATTACQINNRRPRRVFARSSSSAARFVGVPIGETIRSKSIVCLYVPVSKCDDSQVEFFLIAVEMCRFASRFSFFCFVFLWEPKMHHTVWTYTGNTVSDECGRAFGRIRENASRKRPID